MSSFNAVRSYFSEKRVTGSELLSFSVLAFISFFLIYGGVLILQSEDIFKKVYEGFQASFTTGTSSSTVSPTARDLVLDNNKDICTIPNTTRYTFSIGDFGSLTSICVLNCNSTKGLHYGVVSDINKGFVSGTVLNNDKLGDLPFFLANLNTPSGLHCKDLPSDGATTSTSSNTQTRTTTTTGATTGGASTATTTTTGATTGATTGGASTATSTATSTTTGATTGIPKTSSSTRGTAATSEWTADLPEDLTLGQLQKNVNLIRKPSTVNKATGIGMIISGSVIILYQTYKLFF